MSYATPSIPQLNSLFTAEKKQVAMVKTRDGGSRTQEYSTLSTTLRTDRVTDSSLSSSIRSGRDAMSVCAEATLVRD